jgi:hypothetical protein
VAIIDEFAEQVSVLRNLHFEEASARLAGLSDWMEQQPALQNILAELRRKVDGLAIVNKQISITHRQRARARKSLRSV